MYGLWQDILADIALSTFLRLLAYSREREELPRLLPDLSLAEGEEGRVRLDEAGGFQLPRQQQNSGVLPHHFLVLSSW